MHQSLLMLVGRAHCFVFCSNKYILSGKSGQLCSPQHCCELITGRTTAFTMNQRRQGLYLSLPETRFIPTLAPMLMCLSDTHRMPAIMCYMSLCMEL